MAKLRKVREKRKRDSVSPQELGPLIGVSRQTIRNWICKGNIRAFQVGRNFRIPVDEVLRILNRYGLPIPDWLKD